MCLRVSKCARCRIFVPLSSRVSTKWISSPSFRHHPDPITNSLTHLTWFERTTLQRENSETKSISIWISPSLQRSLRLLLLYWTFCSNCQSETIFENAKSNSPKLVFFCCFPMRCASCVLRLTLTVIISYFQTTLSPSRLCCLCWLKMGFVSFASNVVCFSTEFSPFFG